VPPTASRISFARSTRALITSSLVIWRARQGRVVAEDGMVELHVQDEGVTGCGSGHQAQARATSTSGGSETNDEARDFLNYA
jgi:hypothetical protein